MVAFCMYEKNPNLCQWLSLDETPLGTLSNRVPLPGPAAHPASARCCDGKATFTSFSANLILSSVCE